MTTRSIILAAALAAVSAPAAAVSTFNFGGTPTITNANTYNYSVKGVSAVVKGYSWLDATYTPSAFITFATDNSEASVLGALTPTNLSRDAVGFGVCPAGDPAGECNQVETNNRNEIIHVALSNVGGSSFRLARAVFSQVDGDDTLGLFGVDAGGVVRRIGFGGKFDATGNISTGLTGDGVVSSVQNGNTYTVTFDTAGYKAFIFSNNNAANDGYRLNSITAAVPEPATWGLMLLGFGLVGGALRSRRRGIVAA